MPATVSLILPLHDCADLVDDLIRRALEVGLGNDGLAREVIVVDDGSTDGTAARLRAVAGGRIRAFFHPEFLGRGAALRTALAVATGDIIVVHDVGLASGNDDLAALLAPILGGTADVVYGSRNVGDSRVVPRFWSAVGDRLLTSLSNGLTNLGLSDMTSTCKAFRLAVVRGAVLRADGCGIDAELAALFAARGCRVREVAISRPAPRRSPHPGAHWTQGFAQLAMMARCRLRAWDLPRLEPAAAWTEADAQPVRHVRLTRLPRPLPMATPALPIARPTLRPS